MIVITDRLDLAVMNRRVRSMGVMGLVDPNQLLFDCRERDSEHAKHWWAHFEDRQLARLLKRKYGLDLGRDPYLYLPGYTLLIAVYSGPVLTPKHTAIPPEALQWWELTLH